MSTSRELRPDGRAVQAPVKPTAERKAERKADKTGEAKDGSNLEPEAAASLQSSWGNELLQQVTGNQRAGQAGTSSASGAPGAALEGAGTEEKEEVQETETETDLDTARGNLATAAGSGFSAAAPPGGGGGPEQEAPWSVGRWFGGDDEPGPAARRPYVARWRSPSPPLEPDDIPPADAADGGADVEPGPDLTSSRDALGACPIPRGFLNRGLRDAAALCVPAIDPVRLGLLGAHQPFPRARAAVRFLADHGPRPGLARLAAAAGAWLVPPGGGLAEVTCRASAWAEIAFEATGARERWEALAELAVDGHSRARAELAAASMEPGAAWGAVELFSRAAGLGAVPEERQAGTGGPEVAWDGRDTDAARALARSLPLSPFPAVVRPSAAEAAVPVEEDPFAALFREMTGGEDAAPLGFDGVLEGWNRLLASFGEAHVECASVALAVRDWVPADRLVARLRRFQDDLRRVVASAVRTGEAAERAGDHGMYEIACDAFVNALAVAEAARAEVLGGIAADVERALGPAPEPPNVDEAALQPLIDAFAAGRDVAGALAALGDDDSLDPYAALLVRSLRAASAASAGDEDTAWELAARIVEGAAETALPFVLAEGALVAARVLRAAGQPEEDALVPIADGLREAGEGGALQLLVAYWAEGGGPG